MIAKRFENLSIMEKELVYIGKTKDVYALENGKKQVYDWERYYSVIRKYHPDAVISVCGPDVRWIGNEGGKIRKSEWSVIPIESNNSVAVLVSNENRYIISTTFIGPPPIPVRAPIVVAKIAKRK